MEAAPDRSGKSRLLALLLLQIWLHTRIYFT